MTNDQKIQACAQAAHDANRAYCQTIGDHTQFPWDQAPPWLRAASIKGVTGVLKGNTPEQSHEVWVKNMKAGGWTYGPAKDTYRRAHPSIVPYSKLPAEQRAKDVLYTAVVSAMAAALGLERKGGK